jgi:hypothetical protein
VQRVICDVLQEGYNTFHDLSQQRCIDHIDDHSVLLFAPLLMSEVMECNFWDVLQEVKRDIPSSLDLCMCLHLKEILDSHTCIIKQIYS